MHVITYLFKPTESTTPRVSPDVNYGLQVIMMCQRRFISYSKCTPLVGDIDNGEAVHVWGQRVNGNSPYHPLNCAEPQTVLKKKEKMCFE